jgi:mycothiol synthase
VRGQEADPDRRSKPGGGNLVDGNYTPDRTPTSTLRAMRRLEIKRQMASDDIASVSELLDAAARADGRRPLSDHLYLDLVNGGLDGFAGFLASEPGHDHPVAYAQISRGNDAHAFELVIHPHHRYEMATIGPELIEAALEVVAADGGGRVNWWVFEPTTAHNALADAAHMTRGRTLYQMRRSLPTGMDVTIETRSFVPGDDDAAWLSVNNRAFADHGEQGGWTLDTFCQRQQEPWFDPDGFRVLDAVDGDGNLRMAGFCWTKIHPAADTGHDRIADGDIGAQLTLAGLDHLAGRGIGVGMLYVDADNAPAVNLYRRLGFSVHSTNAAFVADIAPAGASPT